MYNRLMPEYSDAVKSLTDMVRNALPVSIGLSGVLSTFSSNTWRFHPYIHTKNTRPCQKQIVFGNLTFADSSRLTDPQHTQLLNSTKMFLYARLAYKHPWSGKTASHSTLITLWVKMRTLLRWMVDNGYTCFTDLTPTVCATYVKACQQEITKRGTPLKPESLANRLIPIETLYNFQEHLIDAPLKNPWIGHSSVSLAGVDQGDAMRKGKTEMIPDRLTRQLAKGALRYIEELSVPLLACQDARMTGQPFEIYLNQLGAKNWKAVSPEIRHLLVSCYVVIGLFSGIRDSEIASLELGCYTEHEGWDGAIYGWIQGTLYKTVEEPKDAEWMVPPVVAKAIEVAARVTLPMRTKLQTRIDELEARIASNTYLSKDLHCQDIEELADCQRNIHALFLSKTNITGRIAALSGQTIGQRLKGLSERLNLKVELSDLAQIQKTDKIRVGEIWPLAPHQFRKTFGVYVARNVLGDVRYLREHYKHWSLDMTLYYAAKGLDYIDEALFSDVLTERDELQSIIIEGWITTENPITGEGSKPIKEWRKRKEVRVAKDHQDLARKLSSGFYIRGTGHSWCTSETCKGSGLYDVLACKDCENRVIDKTHLLVWRGIRYQQIELLGLDDLGDPMWERATSHLRYAEKILNELGDHLEAYPFPSKPSELRSQMIEGGAHA